MNKYPDVTQKLATARTRLILDKPFFGALVLRLPLVAGDPKWCETTFSDGKSFYYNSDYIDALDLEQTQFALSHEALHCALSHFHRRGHRVKHRWDLACDFAINPLLIDDGLKPPPDTLHLLEYVGMTAEEIYPCLADNDNGGERDLEQQKKSDKSDSKKQSKNNNRDSEANKEKQKNPQSDGKEKASHQAEDLTKGGLTKQPIGLTAQQEDELSLKWEQRLAGAAQQALQAGKLTGEMARMVDHLLQPKLPWRVLLATTMSATAREDYSYQRPSSRRGEPAIFPSMRSDETNIVVAIDTSGSIAEDEIQQFISEVNAIKSQVRASITLLTCDTNLNYGCPWQFEAWENFAFDIKIRGGGGTSFIPIFDWIAQQDKAPDLLLYFTDAKGLFPTIAPFFPVTWLVKGKQKVPFGQRVQLN